MLDVSCKSENIEGKGRSPMSGFQYRPFETPETIRLARLPQRSSNSEEKVALEIQHYELPLSAAPPSRKYNALSYVWEDPTKKHLISLNDQDFKPE